jgi:hypothetical protein
LRLIQSYYWHPHACKERIENPNNTLYIPSNKFSILPEMKGYGVLNYNNNRVLTKYGATAADWQYFTNYYILIKTKFPLYLR